jgi:hypothetical protein
MESYSFAVSGTVSAQPRRPHSHGKKPISRLVSLSWARTRSAALRSSTATVSEFSGPSSKCSGVAATMWDVKACPSAPEGVDGDDEQDEPSGLDRQQHGHQRVRSRASAAGRMCCPWSVGARRTNVWSVERNLPSVYDGHLSLPSRTHAAASCHLDDSYGLVPPKHAQFAWWPRLRPWTSDRISRTNGGVRPRARPRSGARRRARPWPRAMARSRRGGRSRAAPARSRRGARRRVRVPGPGCRTGRVRRPAS